MILLFAYKLLKTSQNPTNECKEIRVYVYTPQIQTCDHATIFVLALQTGHGQNIWGSNMRRERSGSDIAPTDRNSTDESNT